MTCAPVLVFVLWAVCVKYNGSIQLFVEACGVKGYLALWDVMGKR
jgi:hypothetical protein